MRYLFESEHLKFRRFELTDADKLYKNHLEKELRQWIPNESYENIEDTEEAIQFYMNCVNKNQLPFVLAIESKKSGELIGDVGVNEVDANIGEVEIGYSICKNYCGNGFATETVAAMTNFVEKTFRIKVLYGRVMKGNIPSTKVMDKSGYKFIREEFGAEDDPYGKGMLIYIKEISSET